MDSRARAVKIAFWEDKLKYYMNERFHALGILVQITTSCSHLFADPMMLEPLYCVSWSVMDREWSPPDRESIWDGY